MKIKINEHGFLCIERAGKMKKMRCPFSLFNDMCGGWCVLFREPEYYPETGQVCLELCHKTYMVNQEDFKDLRNKMPHIPPEVIEEIKQVANIVDIIGEYLPLEKVGKNYVTLCPFHQEDTPSFTVSEEKQIFHCFGCGVGGNVFAFLMKYKQCSFYEAVEEVAERYGINLKEKLHTQATIKDKREEK